MAEIYLAQMAGSDGFSKLVVVKRLLADLAKDNEYVQMFLDEARINARLNHSNIVQVLELGEVDGQYFIAMEYVSGLSIAQVGKLATQRLGEVPQNIACGIMLQSCAGLHHAHETKLSDADELGIIHRDVSPQNLLLTYEGFVKVVDFGIAKAEGRETRTQAGMVKGKFAYMSPEQCTGQKVDRRTDIFALGVILYPQPSQVRVRRPRRCARQAGHRPQTTRFPGRSFGGCRLRCRIPACRHFAGEQHRTTVRCR
jgi:serine/threonine protein kinase